jgi:hypothetical protein
VLVALVVVFALITWFVLQNTYSDLPTLPWTAIPTVLLLALGEGYMGWMTRARIMRKPNTTPVEPLAVARLAALAKASAHAGAIFAGIFGGLLLRVLNLLDLPNPRTDALVGGGSFASCVLLVCAALYLEYCCRVPGDHEDEDHRDRP